MNTRNLTQTIGGLLIFVLIAWGGPAQAPKTAAVKLTEQEWLWVLDVIDNSPTPGETRKAIYNKIYAQAAAQINPDTTRKATDSIKPKPKQ